ncbi:MAG: argininosuccinate lyase [Ignavibacteriae bacterium]|nr:argininosuccinate lyase [Ignavibacteriota bacterium]
MPLWNSRFRKPLAESALKFSSSIDVDRRFYNEDIDGSKAHVQMLVKQKVISAADGKAILSALEAIRRDIASGKLTMHWRDEDVHTFIEEQLVKRVGERGKRLHTGRSRNDQIALDERLFLRREIEAITALTRKLQIAFLRQAERHKKTIVPGYTHLQRAQPILFAHHLLAYVSMLQRDRERFADCLKRVNRSPLGAAAFAGTSLPISRTQVAKALKFDGLVENSIDAVSDRDGLIEFIAACAITMMHLSRFAEEMILWSSHEFHFAHIDDAYATGSSLMPQKKNPDIPELVRGKSGRVFGSLVGLLTVMKGLPLAYNRDMQEDKVHLLDAVDTTSSSLALMTELLAHTIFDSGRFHDELEGDLSLATDIAEYLVAKGMPFRKAHQAAGKVVSACIDKECLLHELSMKEFKAISPLFEEDVFELFRPLNSIKRKISEGSTAPREVEKQIRSWGKLLRAR